MPQETPGKAAQTEELLIGVTTSFVLACRRREAEVDLPVLVRPKLLLRRN